MNCAKPCGASARSNRVTGCHLLAGESWGYRRRARLGARFVHAKARSLVGFREKMSSYVAEVERCEVLRPEVGALVGELGRLLTALSIAERIPQIEVAVGDNGTVLVLRVLEPPHRDADRDKLLEFERRTTCASCCRPADPTSWSRWPVTSRRCGTNCRHTD